MKKRALISISTITLVIIIAVSALPRSLHTLTWPTMVISDGSQDQGLSFRVTQVSSTGATVEYSQRGGTTTGQLVISYFGIYLQKDFQYVLEINKVEQMLDLPLQNDSTGSFDIDWSSAYDPLKPGDYYLGLSVNDMTDNIAHLIGDHESYYIPFTLP